MTVPPLSAFNERNNQTAPADNGPDVRFLLLPLPEFTLLPFGAFVDKLRFSGDEADFSRQRRAHGISSASSVVRLFPAAVWQSMSDSLRTTYAWSISIISLSLADVPRAAARRWPSAMAIFYAKRPGKG